jgi:hypothetical protein
MESAAAPGQELSLDTRLLPPGVYVVQVHLGERMATRRFVRAGP